MPELIEIAHASRRGSSLRISIPKKVPGELKISEGDIIRFYVEDGKIVLNKLS